MSFNIDNFKAKGLTHGGARPSLFEIRLDLPPLATGSDEEEKVRFLAQAASIPASTVAQIPVPYFGRVVYVAGDRTFAPWAINIVNDEDFKVRASIEKWLNAINTHISNRRDDAFGTENYKTNATVYQLAKTGDGTNSIDTAIRAYTFSGLFPTTLEAIPLSWGTQNQIESFGVTFAYDYWVPGDDENGSDTGRFNGIEGTAVAWNPKLSSDTNS